jgi:hypothetical protein
VGHEPVLVRQWTLTDCVVLRKHVSHVLYSLWRHRMIPGERLHLSLGSVRISPVCISSFPNAAPAS